MGGAVNMNRKEIYNILINLTETEINEIAAKIRSLNDEFYSDILKAFENNMTESDNHSSS